jgi:hypothetical protein
MRVWSAAPRDRTRIVAIRAGPAHLFHRAGSAFCQLKGGLFTP